MSDILDHGPFVHGTIADLRPGDLLVAGRRSNYRPEVVMNYVHFTALVDGAGLAAEIATGLDQGPAGPRVYRVEATGPFEDDPNEVDDWPRLTPTARADRRQRLEVLLSGDQDVIIS